MDNGLPKEFSFKHVVLSFWGFIIIAFLSFFVFTKIMTWYNGGVVPTKDVQASKVYWISFDDDFLNGEFSDIRKEIESIKKQGFNAVVFPFFISTNTTYKSNINKYFFGKGFAQPIEKTKYDKAIIPFLEDVCEGNSLDLHASIILEPSEVDSGLFATRGRWLLDQQLTPDLEQDTVALYFGEIADELLVRFKVDGIWVQSDSVYTQTSFIQNPLWKKISKRSVDLIGEDNLFLLGHLKELQKFYGVKNPDLPKNKAFLSFDDADNKTNVEVNDSTAIWRYMSRDTWKKLDSQQQSSILNNDVNVIVYPFD